MVFPKTRKKRVNFFLAEDIAVNIQKMPFQERKPLTMIPVFLGNYIIDERRKRKKIQGMVVEAQR